MPIKLDFTDVKQNSGFEPLPAGFYRATVFEIEPTKVKSPESKNYNEPMLSFTFKLITHNRRAWNNYILNKDNLWLLQRDLPAMGVPAENLVGQIEFEPRDVLGKEVMLEFALGPKWNNPDVQENTIVQVHPAGSRAETQVTDQNRPKTAQAGGPTTGGAPAKAGGSKKLF